MGHDEAELIRRVQQGDQEAFRAIFELYHKKVYRVAYGVVRESEEALDIVQEVFVKLYRALGSFKGRSSLYTFLYRMAVNTAIDHTRRKEKPASASLDEEGVPEPIDDLERGPERRLLQKEQEERVKKAIETLPMDQKTALLLREVEGLSYQEIAEVTRCSIGTVMSRLHYARKKLQEALRDYLKEGETSSGPSSLVEDEGRNR